MVFVQLVEKREGFREVPYADRERGKAGRRHVVCLSRVPTKGERIHAKVDDGAGLPTHALFWVCDVQDVEHMDRSMLEFVPDEGAETFAAVVKVYRLTTDAR